NRAPPRTQAALLEAMQEHSVTASGDTMRLPEPFFVLATQNPIEQEGTYPLPEAQVDRFMMKIRVGYPSRDDERKILDRIGVAAAEPQVSKVATPAQIFGAQRAVSQVFVDDKVRDYIVDLVRATREPTKAGASDLEGMIEYGASPRASLWLLRGARAHAFLQGRTYVTPHDVKSLAPDVLRHRVSLTYEAEAEGRSTDQVIARILDTVLVP
ncbi:MAG TPA: MoxR family ATPase, partial [Candidatus Limnocylindrales bacterium]|nr:MoxR family ATPase [Candidatus Limnocylindrales bacterium]